MEVYVTIVRSLLSVVPFNLEEIVCALSRHFYSAAPPPPSLAHPLRLVRYLKMWHKVKMVERVVTSVAWHTRESSKVATGVLNGVISYWVERGQDFNPVE